MANLRGNEVASAAWRDEELNESENEEQKKELEDNMRNHKTASIYAHKGGSNQEGCDNEVKVAGGDNIDAGQDELWSKDMDDYANLVRGMSSAKKSSSKRRFNEDARNVSTQLFAEDDGKEFENDDNVESQANENVAGAGEDSTMENVDEGEDDFDKFWACNFDLEEDKKKIRLLKTKERGELPFGGNIMIYYEVDRDWYPAKYTNVMVKEFKPFDDENCGRCLVNDLQTVHKAYYRNKDKPARECNWGDHDNVVRELPRFGIDG